MITSVSQSQEQENASDKPNRGTFEEKRKQNDTTVDSKGDQKTAAQY